MRGRESYNDMEAKHVGITTGVEVEYMSDCKQFAHEPIISTETALHDARSEIARLEEIESG